MFSWISSINIFYWEKNWWISLSSKKETCKSKPWSVIFLILVLKNWLREGNGWPLDEFLLSNHTTALLVSMSFYFLICSTPHRSISVFLSPQYYFLFLTIIMAGSCLKSSHMVIKTPNSFPFRYLIVIIVSKEPTAKHIGLWSQQSDHEKWKPTVAYCKNLVRFSMSISMLILVWCQRQANCHRAL